MKPTGLKLPINRLPTRHSRPKALAAAQFSYIRLTDGRFVPVLNGGMVETAINSLGGVLRDIDSVSLSHQEQ